MASMNRFYLFTASSFAARLLAIYLLLACTPVWATQWHLLKTSRASQLMVDKQSIVEQAPYTKAWIKVEYREPQKNVESVDRVYTHAKALWYFDCATHKAATLQVFQYDADALVYAAGIEVKQADFVEPLPESEVEITQQYVCHKNTAAPPSATASRPAVKPAMAETVQPLQTVAARETATAPSTTQTVSDRPTLPAAKASKPVAAVTETAAKSASEVKAGSGKASTATSAHAPAASHKSDAEKKSDTSSAVKWQYAGEQGPMHWAQLAPAFASCGNGQQQSPIAIEHTIPAALKPLKHLQKFPLKSIRNDGHGLQLDAGSGNMLVLDQQPYQMKQIALHFPAEHRIRQKQYAGELQMLHEDKQGHRVILAIMIDTGQPHLTLEKLLGQLPKAGEAPKALALRITPAELMPDKSAYYRYSGSLTTPPCSEGVQWVIMKTPIQASAAQLSSLQQASGIQNQRPLQDHQGRMVLE